MTRRLVIIVIACVVTGAHGSPATAPTSAPTTTPATPTSRSSLLPVVWLTDLDAAFHQAQRARLPVLAIAYQSADARSRAIFDSIDATDDDAVRKSLSKYACVRLDVEQDAIAAELLVVTNVPAMRILTPIGQTIASRDGAMTPAELARWLDANAAQAAGTVSPELLGDGQPSAASIDLLLKALGGSDAAARAAAIRRLTPHPHVAAAKLVEQFASASLAVRLASLELLSAWHAPIDELDPFKPETIDSAALERLREWAARVPTTQPATQPATQPSTLPLTGAQRESIEREIDQMLIAPTDADAFAARERIARAGSVVVLPEVLRRLRQPLEDRQRQRLVALRYRLASTDRVALTWPGGLERLASPDTERRHEAIDELSKIVTSDDAPLLLELFSDADPFIRESSLRMLRSGGTDATSALMKLLLDPEPNVRAAVLKQLAQDPDARAVGPVVEFVSNEVDPDLVVHAVRVLRGTGGARAVECLISLLKNENWRVRGEAAESLQEMIAAGGRGSYSSTATAAGSIAGKESEVYAAMFGLLDDADGYVASRAVITLAQSRDPSGVKAAFEAVQHRPEVLGELTRTMQLDPSIVRAALPSLRKLTASTQPSARAAAITTLGTAVPDSCSDELIATLNDAESQVRIAAATALANALAHQRPQNGSVTESSFLGLSQKRVQIEADKWLTEWRADKRGPAWRKHLAEPLQKMSDPSRPREERLAAAVPLIALGRDEPSMSLLREAATSDPAERHRLYSALPWLAWENRLALFNELAAKDAGEESLAMAIPAMTALADRRAADPLWQMLAKDGTSMQTTATIFNAFRGLYFEGHSYDAATAPIADKPAIAAQFKAKALAAGSDMTRLVAMAMLASLAPDDAAEASATLLADASTPPGVRADAMQLRLMVLDATAGQSLAVEMIGSTDIASRKVALAYLTGDVSRIRSLRGTIDLYIQNQSLETMSNEYRASDAIVLLPPDKVAPEPLRALLGDPDRDCAASAAYLLALLGERDGLPILIEHWRNKKGENQNWERLVYRAISALDDDALTPVLEEIYQSMSKEQAYVVRPFYWTIRNVHGTNALKLRKRIRDDVGMAQLK